MASGNIAVDLGQARAQEWITERLADPTKHRIDPVTNCFIATVGLNQTGYGTGRKWTNAQINEQARTGIRPARNTQMNFLLHRVALLSKNGIIRHYASHLCHVKACFNPDHIVDEPQDYNLARRFCLPKIVCPAGHVLLASDCNHAPRCLKRSPPGVVCCLSRASLSSDENPLVSASSDELPVSGRVVVDPLSLNGSAELALAQSLGSDFEDFDSPGEPGEEDSFPSSPPLPLRRSAAPSLSSGLAAPVPLLSSGAAAPVPSSSSGAAAPVPSSSSGAAALVSVSLSGAAAAPPVSVSSGSSFHPDESSSSSSLQRPPSKRRRLSEAVPSSDLPAQSSSPVGDPVDTQNFVIPDSEFMEDLDE